LQARKEGAQQYILDPRQQRAEIQKFEDEKLKARAELRRDETRPCYKDVDSLGTRVTVINTPREPAPRSPCSRLFFLISRRQGAAES
jgi:hypothetical protein